MYGYLILENGTALLGQSSAINTKTSGELSLWPPVLSLDDALLDPANSNRIVVITPPIPDHITLDDALSLTAPRAIIVTDTCTAAGAHSMASIALWCRHRNVPLITGISASDLYAATQTCQIKAAVVTAPQQLSSNELKPYAALARSAGSTLAPKARVRPHIIYGDGPRMTILDAGIRPSLVSWLAARNYHLNILPPSTGPTQILDSQPDALLIAGGLFHDSFWPAVTTIRELQQLLPIIGAGLGMELIISALGGNSSGTGCHRGENYPVANGSHSFLTFQDHCCPVATSDLKGTGLIAKEICTDDNSVEAVAHQSLPIAAVHYHPEIGGDDVASFFASFLHLATPVRHLQGA